MRETSPFDLDRSFSVDDLRSVGDHCASSSDRASIIERFRQRIAAGDHIKLTRAERDQLVAHFVAQLIDLNQQGNDAQAAIQALCEAEKALLEEGYPQGSLNSVYLPHYTRSLKAAIADGKITLTERNSYPQPWTKRDGSQTGITQTHYALGYLTYDGATQAQLRRVTTAKNNERQDDLQPVHLDAYLRQVMGLLGSEEPEALTIAIAALTGRRFAEVAAVGRFESTAHPYQLRFTGQQKKAAAVAFEIVSLIPVAELLPVLDRFRALPALRAMAGLDDDHPQVQAFNSRVNRRVRSLFERSGLVPVLPGFQTVSIHRLRALYGAIAIHFFCANNQHLHRFLQNHLGHVLTQEVGASNARATDHYFHYYLVKADGSPITARGIKLMAHGALREGEPGQPAAVGDSPASKPRQAALRILPGTSERWNQWLGARFPDHPNQAARMQALLTWLEQQPVEQASPAERAEPQVEDRFEERAATAALQETLAALMARLDRLEQQQSPPGDLPPPPTGTMDPTLPPQRRRSHKATDRAAAIFQAVQAWNHQHPDQTFAMTLGLLKDEFGINFKAAKFFLESHQNEIQELHQRSGVQNPRSHNRQLGRDLSTLKQFVQEALGQYTEQQG